VNASDRRALKMCELALAKLATEPDRIRAAAAASIATWERVGSCGDWYQARWRELLAGDPTVLAATLLAATDEGQALHANSAFAGIFSRAERNAILAAGHNP